MSRRIVAFLSQARRLVMVLKWRRAEMTFSQRYGSSALTVRSIAFIWEPD